MKKIITILLGLSALFVSCKKETSTNLTQGIYAEIETSKGNILLQLEYKKTPATVANFIGLAQGNHPMVDAQYKNKPFYDGLKFHRVISDFMIQGGDPLGTGEGGPGYEFQDEFISELKHDKAGILSMANAGPQTNGSQFFITHKEQPHLNGLHTVFGHVVKGQEVVDAIEQNDIIKHIKIIRVGTDAEKFDAPKVFKELNERAIKNKESKQMEMAKVIEENKKMLLNYKQKAIKTKSGLSYYVFEKGANEKPKNGQQIKIHYAGFFEDGNLFDTSIEKVAEKFNTLDMNRKAANQYQPLSFTYGIKEGLIPGFIEGIEQLNIKDKAYVFIPSELAYGSNGYPPVIAPNTSLIFQLEIEK